MCLLMAVRPLLPESSLRSVLQLAQQDTASSGDAWHRALVELLQRDVALGGASPLSTRCQSQLRDLCGRLGQGGRGLKLALASDPEPEDRCSQLCGKRSKEPEEEPASPESERAPKRFRGCEEEEEVVEGKDQEERPQLESWESPSEGAGGVPDTEADMPETTPGAEEAKGPAQTVELPKVVQVPGLGSWLQDGPSQ